MPFLLSAEKLYIIPFQAFIQAVLLMSVFKQRLFVVDFSNVINACEILKVRCKLCKYFMVWGTGGGLGDKISADFGLFRSGRKKIA